MSARRPVAVVTGAARGIGAAIAMQLAQEGFDVAVSDLAEGNAAEVVAKLRALGARAQCFAFDLADVASHAAVVEGITAWGGAIDCLVNNAGVGSPARGDLLDVSPAAFDFVTGVNLRGTFFFTQAIARCMAAIQSPAPRTIVTISSVSVEMASIERGEYCMSKSPLAMLTRLFAVRLAPLGISVFDVRPGVIRTSMTEGVASKYEKRFAEGLVPMNRWGLPEDMARAVGALASGRLAFATGSVLHVDGALSVPRL